MGTFTWTTKTSGDWAIAADWSPATVPNATTATAILPGVTAVGGYTVTIGSGESEIVNAITLGDLTGHVGPTLNVAGTLTFGGGSPSMAFLSGTMAIAGGGVLAGVGSLGNSQGAGPFVLVNNGTVLGNAGTNQSLTVLTAFTNNGTVLANNGNVGVQGPAGLTNLSGTTLTGGTWIAKGPSTGAFNQIEFGFNFDATIAVDSANIILDGGASDIQGYSGPTGVNGSGADFVPLEQQLQTIASGGTLQLLDSRGYTTANSLRDNGALVLQGGTLNTGGLTLGSTGLLSGMGVVNGAIANQGGITASDGALDLTSPITGTGGFTVASGATLILDGATPTTLNNSGTVYDTSGLLDIQTLTGSGSLVVQNSGTLEFASATAQDVGFSGSNATLRLDNFAGYAGTLVGFSQGDTIVLAGTSATKAFVSGTSLVVMNNASTIDTIQLAGSYASNASFSVANQGSNVAVSNTGGAPLQQDFQFTVLTSDTAGLSTAQENQIANDLSAAALDWAQYITGHTTLRIQLDIVSGTSGGSELATGGATTNISNGATLDGRSLLLPSSLIALTTGSYVQGAASDITVTLFAGNLGNLYVNPAPTPTPSGSVPSGKFDLVTVFRHELAHGFGFGGLTTSGGSIGSQETQFDHFIQTVNGTVDFTGPNAEAAYGTLLGTGVATPVPLTDLVSNGEDFAHFANSTLDVNATDLMSGLGLPAATQRDISPIDLAVLQDVGEPVTAGVVPPAPVPRTLVWTGASSSSFATAQNWNDITDGVNPAVSAPGSIDAAQFTSGGGTITGTGTAATLLFSGANAWTVTSSAGLMATSGIAIGTSGAGTLTVNGAAGISSQGTTDVISGAAGNSAVLVVSGKGTAWNSAGELKIGDQGGGTLDVNQQASVSTSAQPGLFAAALGASSGGEGWLDVTGGSSFTAFGQLNVGQSGTGHLLVENQGTVRTGGNAAVDASQGFDIAQSSGGAGDATVTGTKSLLTNSGRFIVGDAGFGSLLIGASGTVITTPGTVAGLSGAVIAGQAGSDGSGVSVTGAGSDWQVTGLLAVGNGAAGSLAITAGGTVSAGQMDSGVIAGSSGIVSVIGTGSTLTLTGQLTVGDGSSAELSILNGATVNANNADIGLNAGGTGNVDIEGSGSRLDIGNNLNIGDSGVGVLTLGNNTELTVANNINVGANGILNQLGGSIDPSTITIAPSGRQGGHGITTASVEISNAGTLFASSGTETVNTPLITAPSGKSGVLEIDTNGDMVLNVTSVDATQSVTFTDGTGILTLGTIGGFAATIGTVNPGDQIIVQGTSIAADSYNTTNDVLTLFNGTAGTIGTLQLGPSVNGFALLPNGSGGITAAPCFAAGTRISTERGEVAVEDLRAGDRVQVVAPTPASLHSATPDQVRGRLSAAVRERCIAAARVVLWIGHRYVDCTRHPDPRKVWPVRVAAGALGPGRPWRDLFLSPDHAVYIGDVLIPVRLLINGTSIAQVPRDDVSYYHVELPRHSLLLAEGLPAESYLDTGDRSNFTNGGGPIALHPDFGSRVWEAEGCAPLVVTGLMLDAAKRWVNSIAAETRWAA